VSGLTPEDVIKLDRKISGTTLTAPAACLPPGGGNLIYYTTAVALAPGQFTIDAAALTAWFDSFAEKEMLAENLAAVIADEVARVLREAGAGIAEQATVTLAGTVADGKTEVLTSAVA
jgi:hypothetical protein